MNDWGKVRGTKRGKIDKRTKIAKALRNQGEQLDKNDKVSYTIPKEKVAD